jgi:hypothetical protein
MAEPGAATNRLRPAQGRRFLTGRWLVQYLPASPTNGTPGPIGVNPAHWQY